MNWFKKLLPLTKSEQKKGVPEGLWTKCDACSAMLYQADLENNLSVCPKCEYHHRIGARKRIDMILDPEKRIELESVDAVDHLKFRDSKKYVDRLKAAKKDTAEKEALITFQGFIKGIPLVVSSFDFFFMGGSMGSAVGENFVRAANRALEYRIPFVCFSASGGARMQEGLISLMQMAKTSAVLAKLSEAKIPFISVLTDPTMGGVSASLAMLGDLIIAEPNALIGFAGPRVIEQTVRAVLPPGFQKSEFLLNHGGIDMIIDRRQMRDSLASILSKLLRQPSSIKKNNQVNPMTSETYA